MTRRRARAVLLAVAALALVAADAPESDARLRSVVGDVEIALGPRGSWSPAHSGDPVPHGASIRTGIGGRAEIALAAGVARLFERSLARVPDGREGARQVDLSYGAASFEIRPRQDAEPFEVRTDSSVVLVKGTRFTVTAEPDGSTVSVSRGMVGVRAPGSLARELLVHAGFGATGGAGRPFALGLPDRKGDPWDAWLHGRAPSRPLPPPAAPGEGGAPPASPDGALVLQSARDATLHIIASREDRRVQIVGSDGFDATLSKGDLDQILRGNTAVLSPRLLAMLRTRGVTPAAFAHQVLDNL